MRDEDPAESAARDNTVQSVDRAISLLQALASRGALGLADLAAEVGMHRATVYRLLTTMEIRGVVAQDEPRGPYRLGPTIVQLAAGVAVSRDVAVLCRPLCAELAEAVGETVNLVVSNDVDVTTVDQAAGGSFVALSDYVGQRSPMHATAAGKVFLAEWPADRLAELCGAGLKAFTEHTLVEHSALEADLRQVRSRGWSLAQEEHEVGLVAVGAPVRGADGAVVAALTVGGPAYRMTQDALSVITERLLATAARASWRLGAPKPTSATRT
ncbi:transcriptional regulator, IclR family [Quadrisphaera granulorum]|uniref:Glycerol operon regulatory protein n=1 Tax=Quadrisphaera granulorum TaxID=317664 RepID=A0A316A7G3_9ACTN|nr:IclR family transcriptional regulator [Quadrisphaera granulorum]PWJ53876.1 IclR family transcriptional regulator [Quadrisphaera granulorum]SZE96633.1 transcriptional regulator, IclR family [Quadrisphaera granulorum]